MGFGGSDEDLELYGQLPGLNELAQQLWPTLSSWIPNWESGGMPNYPALRPAVGLYRTSMPQYHAAGARLQDMMSPEWLTATAPGLETMSETERAAMERDIDRTQSELIMKYGSHGQTSSSPMVGALADAELGAREAQRTREAQRQYEAYQQKMGMMPGLIQQARGEPYQSAEMVGDRSSELIDALLKYLSIAKPQATTTTDSFNLKLW
jgi:hypothetical protein